MRRQKKRAIVAEHSNQSKIEDYFQIVKIIDELVQLRKVNECFKEKLMAMEAKFDTLQSDKECQSKPISLLTRMMNQALKQAGKKSRGLRHDDPVLEHFCLSIWILGGRRVHEIFNTNFPESFPSPTTIHQRLLRFDLSVNEGSLNIAAVKDFLIANNAPLTVCLSEDATGVGGRVEYYAKTNSLIGFCGPPQQKWFSRSKCFRC